MKPLHYSTPLHRLCLMVWSDYMNAHPDVTKEQLNEYSLDEVIKLHTHSLVDHSNPKIAQFSWLTMNIQNYPHDNAETRYSEWCRSLYYVAQDITLFNDDGKEAPKCIALFKKEWDILSNFNIFNSWPIHYEAPFGHFDVETPYQAAKTNDQSRKEEIWKAGMDHGPSAAKRLGSDKRKTILRDNWDEIKLSVMSELVQKKFDVPHRKNKLMSTGYAVLVEGNRHRDTYWGICDRKGCNALGILQMAIRMYSR